MTNPPRILEKLYQKCPEVYRSVKEEFKSQRILTALILGILLNLLIAVFESLTKNMGITLFPIFPEYRSELAKTLMGAQYSLISFWCVREVMDSYIREKADKTWDIVRMTPQSPLQIICGKIIGPSLFPIACSLSFFPFILFYAFTGEGVSFGQYAYLYLFGILTLFTQLALTLCVALHYKEEGKSGPFFMSAVFLFIVTSTFFFKESAAVFNPESELSFALRNLGSDPSPILKNLFYALANFLWCLGFAKWKLSQDLLEDSKLYWIPLLMLSFAALAVVHSTGALLPFDATRAPPFLSLLTSATYFISLTNQKSLDDTRKWLIYSSRQEKLQNTPIWIQAAAVLLPASILVPLLCAEIREGFLIFYIFSWAIIVLRDLAVLQLIYWKSPKRSGLLSFVILLLLHGIPMVLFHKVSPMDFIVGSLSFDLSNDEKTITLILTRLIFVVAQFLFASWLLKREFKGQESTAAV